MFRRLVSLGLSSSLALALSACGGGDSASTTASTAASAAPTVASSLSGVVATGRAIGGVSVTAIDPLGNQCGRAQTQADGSYNMKTQCAAGPLILAVLDGAPNGVPLGALALPNATGNTVGGTVNLTPLTTLSLYQFLANQTVLPGLRNQPDFAHVVAALVTLQQTFNPAAFWQQVNQAKQAIVQAVAPALRQNGVNPDGFDPVTTPFVANGQGVDAFFDLYPAAAPQPNVYRLGGLLSLQLPEQAGGSPIYGGSAAAGLSAGLTASASNGTPSSGMDTSAASAFRDMAITVSSFTGTLAGSQCQARSDAGQVSGQCTLQGKTYPMVGTLNANGFGVAILNLKPANGLSFLLVATTPSSGGASDGAWVDPLGAISGASASGNAAVQFSPL